MAQNNNVLAERVRYTRADYTALRAWLNRIPLPRIASLYYSPEDLDELDPEQSLRARLNALRDQCIARAIDTNPHLAGMMDNARAKGLWSPTLVNLLVAGQERDASAPSLRDPLSVWFKPNLLTSFKSQGCSSIADLVEMINRRGAGWWRPIPRLGAGRAARIENWLKQFSATVGSISLEPEQIKGSGLVVLSQGDGAAPLERILLPIAFDGSAGTNRNHHFALISARHDLDAIEAYLKKFADREKTQRAYRKEIERFLLWCVTVRGIPLSSVLHDECEAYKDFLKAIPEHWISDKQRRNARHSTDWKPFAGQLSAESQKYAVQAVSFFFNWLVDVRYLHGNPWKTIAMPSVQKQINPMQIHKAIPQGLWEKLSAPGGILDQLCDSDDAEMQKQYRLRGSATQLSMSAQFRMIRAALFLLGMTGIRREEAAYTTRNYLRPIPGNEKLWELDVLGKRQKWRMVFPPVRAIEAIRTHWKDRGQDFEFELSELPLISPVAATNFRTTIDKHVDSNGQMKENGFSPDGLYRAIKIALGRIADDDRFDLSDNERNVLRGRGLHAFRHLFGGSAVARGVPLDVVQKTLGHASLQTTTIYVQAEKQRSIEELSKALS